MKVKIIGLCAACLASGIGLGLIVQLNERPERVVPVHDVLSAGDIFPRECSLISLHDRRALQRFATSAVNAGLIKSEADIWRQKIIVLDGGDSRALRNCWQALLDEEYVGL